MTYYTGRIPAPEMAKWSSVWDIDRNGTAYHWRLPEPNPLLPDTPGLRPPLDMGDTSPDTKRLSSVTVRDVNPRWIDDVAGQMPNANLSRHFFLREEGRAFVGKYFASPVDRTPYGSVEIETRPIPYEVHAVVAARKLVDFAARQAPVPGGIGSRGPNVRVVPFWRHVGALEKVAFGGYSDKWPLAFDIAVEANAVRTAKLKTPETMERIEMGRQMGVNWDGGLFFENGNALLNVLLAGADGSFASRHAERHLDADAVVAIAEDEALPSPVPHRISSWGDTKADEIIALVRRVSPYLPRTPSHARHPGPMKRRPRSLRPLEVPLMDRMDNQTWSDTSRLEVIHQITCSEGDILCAGLKRLMPRLIHRGGPPLPKGARWLHENGIEFRSSSTNPHEMLQKIVDWKASVRDHINATVIEMKVRIRAKPEKKPTGAYEQQRLAWGLNPDARGRSRSLARAGAINPESVADFWHRYFDNDAPEGAVAIFRSWLPSHWDEFCGRPKSTAPSSEKPSGEVTILPAGPHTEELTRKTADLLHPRRVVPLPSSGDVLRYSAQLPGRSDAESSRRGPLLRALGALPEWG
eukprot:Polyplicarium_translucidae@DN3367_c0_g1_i2.p1